MEDRSESCELFDTWALVRTLAGRVDDLHEKGSLGDEEVTELSRVLDVIGRRVEAQASRLAGCEVSKSLAAMAARGDL